MPMNNQAEGYSLIYNQLYPFEGLKNYTSGIIHHVRLTGMINSNFLCARNLVRLSKISRFHPLKDLWCSLVLSDRIGA